MYSAAIPYNLHEEAKEFLLRQDGQEDLCFALWYPSQGRERMSGLISHLIFPKEGDRIVDGKFSSLLFRKSCWGSY
jgi:hypothetical protein